MNITVERHTVDGFTLYAIKDGYLVQQRYIGYTLRESKALFRAKFGD
jgi:hypothetical protein